MIPFLGNKTIAKFQMKKPRYGPYMTENRWDDDWEDYAEKRTIVRLGHGENMLNEGRRGGGITSDVEIPGFVLDEKQEYVWFDWVAFFSVLFMEEMVLRRITEVLVCDHLSMPLSDANVLRRRRNTCQQFGKPNQRTAA
jgi:hypothetical protein